MTNFRFPRIAVSAAMVALLCSAFVQPAHAQTPPSMNTSSAGTWQLDSTTNMRQIPAAPSVNDSTGAPASSFPSTPGCSTTQGQAVFSSLQNTASYGLAQKVAVHVNTLQTPTSISSCLQGLIQNFSQYTNAFSGGFSFSAFINSFFSSMLTNVVNDLEKQACQDINKAASGIVGDLGKINYANLLNGGVLITANPGGGGTKTTTTNSCTPGAATSTAALSYKLENGVDQNGNPISSGCQSGWTYSQGMCYYCASGSLTVNSAGAVCYSCPAGANLSGTKCTCPNVNQ